MAQNGGLRPSPYSVFLHESCRYPIWVWSDLHLGDQAALKAFRRPFPSVQVMTARLLAAWRRTVPDGDLVILRLERELQAEVFTYPMRSRIPTVNVRSTWRWR